jgi:hypothetical protein
MDSQVVAKGAVDLPYAGADELLTPSYFGLKNPGSGRV